MTLYCIYVKIQTTVIDVYFDSAPPTTTNKEDAVSIFNNRKKEPVTITTEEIQELIGYLGPEMVAKCVDCAHCDVEAVIRWGDGTDFPKERNIPSLVSALKICRSLTEQHVKPLEWFSEESAPCGCWPYTVLSGGNASALRGLEKAAALDTKL